jgi:methionine--tRNA ligase
MSCSAPAYITTPIYYVNDRPHIGHAYTTTLCDVWARAMRFDGRDVFFLTGTDEHGAKVEKSAKERGITPQALADENSAEFRKVLTTFGLTNNDFIRTTEPRHEEQVKLFVLRLIASGDIYLGEFEGWYDEGQEEYVTDTRAKELEFKSPISGKPLVRAKEHNYYFKLSGYQAKLEAFFAANPGFVRPAGRFNEVLGRMRDGLQDVPVTRTNFSWGIGMPGASEHVIYVWIDALFNYATALGLGDTRGALATERAKYWPPQYHVIGKEILWFHAVIWPALLMALELPTPKCVYAHSFWISNGQKMSKSLGNFIDLATIESYIAKYGLDAWRWYMITQGPLGATDADFSPKHFHEIYTANLVNTFANCASRTSAMIEKYFGGVMPDVDTAEVAISATEGAPTWSAFTHAACAKTLQQYADFELAEAADTALSIVRAVDASINETQPFKLAKDPAKMAEVARILAACAEGVRVAAVLLTPIMPAKCAEVLAAYGSSLDLQDARTNARWGGLKGGTRIAKCAPFMRVEAPTVVASA